MDFIKNAFVGLAQLSLLYLLGWIIAIVLFFCGGALLSHFG